MTLCANQMPEAFSKTFENINASVATYINAVNKSNTAMWQGVEEITRSLSGLSQESFARAVSAYSMLASAKSPQEALETHTDFVKESFDSCVASSSKVSEISVRTAQDALNPLTQHANDAIHTVMKKTRAA